MLAAGRGRRRRGHRLAGQLAPAQREVRGHVGDRGAAQPGADVVPAQPPPRRVIGGVVAVAAEVGHVDAAHERDPAVDHDGLLVVAVKRMLAGIELTADLRLAHQLLHALAHLGA